MYIYAQEYGCCLFVYQSTVLFVYQSTVKRLQNRIKSMGFANILESKNIVTYANIYVPKIVFHVSLLHKYFRINSIRIESRVLLSRTYICTRVWLLCICVSIYCIKRLQNRIKSIVCAYIYVLTYTAYCCHIYSLLHVECSFFVLKSQSMIYFSRSLSPLSVEERPRRLRLEIEINDTPNAIGCKYIDSRVWLLFMYVYL